MVTLNQGDSSKQLGTPACLPHSESLGRHTIACIFSFLQLFGVSWESGLAESSGVLSLICSLAGEVLVAVKLDGLGSLLQREPAVLEMIQTWGPKLINCLLFPPHLTQCAVWGCTSSPSGGISKLPHPYLPSQGRGIMKDKK